MTLKGHYAPCFKTTTSFGAHHENLNENRPILSATKIYPNDSRFWQYKVYADIRGGSLERERVKRQWGNRKRRFSALSYATSSAPQEMSPTFLYTTNCNYPSACGASPRYSSCNYPSSGRSFVSVRQVSPPPSSGRILSSVRQVSLSRSVTGVS